MLHPALSGVRIRPIPASVRLPPNYSDRRLSTGLAIAALIAW